MPWSILDEYPQDEVFASRCATCSATELDRPNQPERDKVVHAYVRFPYYVGDELVTYDGPAAFCSSCIGEVAAQLGWIQPDKADALRTKNRDLGRRAKISDEKLKAYEELGARLRDIEV